MMIEKNEAIKLTINTVKGEVNFNKFERESVMEDLNRLFFLQKFIRFISSLILMIIFWLFCINTNFNFFF